MRKGDCFCGRPQKENGNCPFHGEDELPVQCVGPWAKEKHNYLTRYIEATAGPRSKFVLSSPEHPRPGGAAFIDLFAGPGRSRIDKTGEFINGSPLIAAEHSQVPFTKLIYCELDEENVHALSSRTRKYGDRVTIISGDCIDNIDRVVSAVPEHGLNFALVDPFGPKGLRWKVLQKLGQLKRMDFLIHFPTNSIKRNFHNPIDIDAIVGTSDWRIEIRDAQHVTGLFEYLRKSLIGIGYSDENVRSLAIKNDNNAILYHLIYATKDKLGNKIWESIAKTDARGQRSLF